MTVCTCGDRNGHYNEQYDAYFCKNCWKWLEEGCGDPGCEFCAGRPDEPPREMAVLDFAKKYFSLLTDEGRADVARDYCRHCWRADPGCQCRNDE